MRYINPNNILCLTKAEYVRDGICSETAFWHQTSRNAITVHGYGDASLIEFESLPAKYKALVNTFYGNPYSYAARQPLLDLVKLDMRARDFFGAYVLPDGRNLPLAHQYQYARQADWLNMIRTATEDKAALKDLIKRPVEDFWGMVIEMYSADKSDAALHKLPTSEGRLREKVRRYNAEGYAALITGKIGNQNTRKVNPKIEALILALYMQPSKPNLLDTARMYDRFISGEINVVDMNTGELFDPKDFNVDGEPYKVSAATVRHYINKPANKAVVDRPRMSKLQWETAHRPFMQRLAPVFAFSKITMDDTSSPFKQHNGVRPATYKVFDVASGALVEMVMHRDARPDVNMIRHLLAKMLGKIVNKGWGMPYEIEVENALTSSMAGGINEDGTLQNDVLTTGAVFPWVRYCAPVNPQEKDAEGFIRQLKYQYQRHREGFQRRPFARLDANRFSGSKSESRRFEFDEIEAMEREDMELWNNTLHPNQKQYPGLTRWQVLEQCQNPALQRPNLPLIMPYIGLKAITSVRRGFVQVQYKSFRLSDISHLGDMTDTRVTAYWLPSEGGEVERVFLYQDGQFICEAHDVDKFQKAKIEQTEEDRKRIGKQKAYINGFDTLVEDTTVSIPKVGVISAENTARIAEMATTSATYDHSFKREDHEAEAWVSDETTIPAAEVISMETKPKRGGKRAKKVVEKGGVCAENDLETPTFYNDWNDLEAIRKRAQSSI